MSSQKKDFHGNPEQVLDIDDHDSIILQDLEKPQNEKNEVNQSPNKDKFGSTSPLGSLGFGMATVMLNLANAGCYTINGMVLGMGFWYGGLGQLISGVFEIIKGNTFSATTTLSSACFWFSFVTMWICPSSLGCAETSNESLATFNLVWGIFTACMMVAVMKNGHLSNKILFVALTINFILIAVGFFISKQIIVQIGGGFGVISGAIGIYNGCAEIMNGEFHHHIIPF